MSNIIKRNTDVVNQPGQKIRTVTRETLHEQDMVIADLSGSMASRAFDNRSRYQCLQEALAPFKGRVQVLAFNSHVWEVDADSLPSPDNFTAMHKALDTAIILEPIHVLLISDGLPDSREHAFDSARTLANQCIIDVMYIGPEDSNAESFMRQLADIGRGRYFNFKIDKQSPALLEAKIDSLLALPAPGSIQL